MRDVRLVAWLRWRQLRSASLYWLTLVGYEPGRQGFSARMYDLYLVLFGAGWALAMLAVAFHQAAEVGASLRPEFLKPALDIIPPLVLLVQALFAVGALRSSPLKLTFADMAHLAGSPLPRPVLTLAGLAGQALRNALATVAVAALVAEGLAPLMGPGPAGFPAFRAAGAALPLAILSTGIAWTAGLLWLEHERLRHVPLLWLLPVALVPLARFVPCVLLWPGHVLTQAIRGPYPTGQVWLLWLLAAASVGAVGLAGRRVSMIDVCADSGVYARIKALGVMAWLTPNLAQDIRHQASLAGRRPLLHLPKAPGPANLLARGLVVAVRHPGPLVQLPIWSGLIAQAAGWLVLPGAGSAGWVTWLLLVLFVPAGGLDNVFNADLSQPFLRQLLPMGNLPLLLADTAAPLALMTLGALGIWLWPGRLPETALAGSVTIVLMGLLVVLCRGLSLVRVGPLGTRVPYQIAVLAAAIAVIFFGTGSGAPVVVALAVDAVLAAMVAGSRTIVTK